MSLPTYRPEIDGLRAVAVLPVILYHAGLPGFEGGFVGVDVFFVISGYLITTIILRELNEGTFSLVRFYERRARRILPALFLVMLCCVPLAWAIMVPSALKSFGETLIATALFASNFYFWQDSGYFASANEVKPLIHTWSLAVEEQYYIFVPLALMAIWALGGRLRIAFLIMTVVAIASFVVADWGSSRFKAASFFLLPTRAWELMIGGLAAVLLLRGVQFPRWLSESGAWMGLALIGIAIGFLDGDFLWPGRWALLPVLGTALIVLFADSQTSAARVLKLSPLVGLGLISYSAYLWHQPLFAFARLRDFSEPGMTVMLALSVLSLALAWVSWRFVERPFRDRKVTSRRLIFMAATVGSVAVMTHLPRPARP